MKHFEHGGNIYKAAAALEVAPESLIDFSANINPMGPSRLGLEVMSEATKYITAYPDPNYTKLKEALASYFESEQQWVIPYNGAIEGLHEVIRYIQPKTALIFAPTFVEYEKALLSVGSRIERVYADSSSHFKFTEECVQSALDQYKPELIVVCSPNNPTGQLLEPRIFDMLFKAIKEQGIKLLVDEAFIDFTNQQSYASSLSILSSDIAERLYVSRSLTKFFGVPGLRLGAMVTRDQAFHEWRQLNGVPWNVNIFAEYYAYGALTDTLYQIETRKLIHSEKERLINGLSQFSWLNVYESQADYMLIQLVGQASCDQGASQFEHHLLKHRLLIRNCGNYNGMDGHYFRIAVKSKEANNQLLEAFEAFHYES